MQAEEEQYEEINMGENKEIKTPDIDIIDENVNDELEEAIKVNEKLDSFIVNLDYFGENENMESSTGDLNDRVSRTHETGYIINHIDKPSSVIVQSSHNLNSSLEKQKLDGGSSKAISMNQIKGDKNDNIIKPIKFDVSVDDEYLIKEGIVKGTKAYNNWWKKKRSNWEDLLMAAEAGNLEQVKDLLDKEIHKEFVADIRFEGLDDFTALHFAAQENRYDVWKFLIENGADWEAKSSIGRTPLHLSSLKGHAEIVELLLNNGAELNCKDSDLYTPLHYASEMGNVEWTKILIEKGADLTIRNNLGARPSDICMNIDVRSIINKYEDDSDTTAYDTGSKRDTFHTVILHNDRKSYVQRLMGRFQKVDRYLKDYNNGNEEGVIQSIEAQQKLREEERKRERNNAGAGFDLEKPK